MKRFVPWLLVLVAIAAALPASVRATDVDGANDCQRNIQDFGDAPEGTLAYPGVPGAFPTCLAPGPVGTVNIVCPSPIPAPGPAGYVRHLTASTQLPYWLGCGTPAIGPSGIDSESDGKVNATGAPVSFCSDIAVDCFETAFGMTFGQDECYGGSDAGVAAFVRFRPCQSSAITFSTYSCATQPRQAYLNILVDWNEDGDWLDNFDCPGTPNGCTSEWSVMNVPIDVLPGCQSHVSPAFFAGPRAGRGWMRITISDTPVAPDFPWAGSANTANGYLSNGETEDYPVTIANPGAPCTSYEDWGDAPEEVVAYSSGVIGHFPTCAAPGAPGTMEIACGTASGSLPGPTGFVRHLTAATDTVAYWFGCDPAAPNTGVDSETDGKGGTFNVGGGFIGCNAAMVPDCLEPAFGMVFGQDECYGDADAGIAAPVAFYTCSLTTVRVTSYLCANVPKQAYLNVLVDWNHDGDWNDNVACLHTGDCAPEWAVHNVPVVLDPGCNSWDTPLIRAGNEEGEAWMRITLSEQPAPADFPWAGTATMAVPYFSRGETEDYPVRILPTVLGVAPDLPRQPWLGPATPNPAHGPAGFRFGLASESHLTLAVYDVTGRRVRGLLDGVLPAGEHPMTWDFRDDHGAAVAAGLYLVRLEVAGTVYTSRVIRLP